MRRFIYLFLMLLLSLSLVRAEKDSNQHLLDQLIKLNKYWLHQENTEGLKHIYQQLSEKELIQAHLTLVENTLRNKPLKQLTKNQRVKRLSLLDELKKYAEDGIFPINLHHAIRTPYFIDDSGRACAVGQLIIKSGQATLAKKISSEMNYAYIENMPYAELGVWANEHGFTVDELKWIQPGYGPVCNPGQVIQPSCHNGTGCFNPDWRAAGLVPPLNYYSEYNDGTGWTVDSNNIWMFWGARIGQHRITITDSLNFSALYNYTINNVPRIPLQASIIDQSSAAYCNGEVTLSVNNTTTVISTYELHNNTINFHSWNNTGHFDSLCTGTYQAIVYDMSGCSRSMNLVINNSTGLEQFGLSKYVNVASPVQDILEINIPLSGAKLIRLYSLTGRLELERTIYDEKSIPLHRLQDGMYVLQVSYKGMNYNRKLIKAK